MTTDIGLYTPLKTIIAYTLDECEKSIGDADRLWVIGLRALTDLSFDISGQTKTVRLPVEGNKTVPFPADLLSWSKIGNLNENGEIVTLRINNALTTFRGNNPNRLADLTADINNGVGNAADFPYYENYYYNNNCYHLFGTGSGVVTYGDCTVDEKNKVIILGVNFRYDSIMLEYISSPERDDDYQVLTCLQEAIIAFIKWKLKLATPNDYYAEAIKARRRLPKKRVNLQTFAQVIRDSGGMTMKA
jgi:hypothetical protein